MTSRRSWLALAALVLAGITARAQLPQPVYPTPPASSSRPAACDPLVRPPAPPTQCPTPVPNEATLPPQPTTPPAARAFPAHPPPLPPRPPPAAPRAVGPVRCRGIRQPAPSGHHPRRHAGHLRAPDAPRQRRAARRRHRRGQAGPPPLRRAGRRRHLAGQ